MLCCCCKSGNRILMYNKHQRRLIPNEHQQEYAMLTPYFSPKTREVKLRKRKGAKSLGFSIRGGKEHGIGIFISDVEPSSEAHLQGLRIGDQILRVNGCSIEHAIHREVINIFRSKNDLTLKVRSVGLIPVKDRKQDPVTWRLVESRDSLRSSPVLKDSPSLGSTNSREIVQVKLFIDMTGHSNLGCSICKGPTEKPGIYIQSTKEGGLARDVGLRAGDQIIGVNGIDFLEADFQDAVKYIKAHQRLEFLIRKGVACDLFPGESSGYNSSSSSVNGEINADDALKKLPTLEEEAHEKQYHIPNSGSHFQTLANGHGDHSMPMNVQRNNSVDDNNESGLGEICLRMEEHKLNNNDDESDTSIITALHDRPGDSDPPDGASSMSSQSDESEALAMRLGKTSPENDDVTDRGIVREDIVNSVLEDIELENEYSMQHRKLSEQLSIDERIDAEMVVQEIVRAAEEEMQKRAWEDRLLAEAGASEDSDSCTTSVVQGQESFRRGTSPTPSSTDSMDGTVPEKDDPSEPEIQKPSPPRSADIWRRTVIAEVHNNPLPVPPPLPKDEPESPASKPKVQPSQIQRPVSYLPEPPPQPTFMNSLTMSAQHLQEAKKNIPESPPPPPKNQTMPSKKIAEEMQKKMHHDQLIEEFKRVHKMMFEVSQETKQPQVNGSTVAPVLQNWPATSTKDTQVTTATDNSNSQSFLVPLAPPTQFADPCRGEPKRSSLELREGRAVQRQMKSSTPSPTPPSFVQELERLKPPDNPALTSWQRTVQERNQSPSRMAALTEIRKRSPSPSSPPLITDSRYEVPKPPSFFFPKEGKPVRRGPLVTIGTYQSTSNRPAPNRFGFLQQITSGESPPSPKKSPQSLKKSPVENVPARTNASQNTVTVTHNGSVGTKTPPTSVQVNVNASGNTFSNQNGDYPPVMSNLTSNKVTIQVPATEPPRTIVRVDSPPSTGNRVMAAVAAVAAREPNSILKQAGKAPNAVRKKSLSFEECPIIIEELSKPESVVVEDFNPLNLFTKQQVAGREVKMFSIPKANPLDIQIEGGLGSFLAGRVIVADILEGGEIYKHGVISKGDQLMWVNGHSLLDITLSQAQGVLRDAAKNMKEPLKLIVAKAPPGLYDDVTFF